MKNTRFNNPDMLKINLYLINQIRLGIKEERRYVAERLSDAADKLSSPYHGAIRWYPAPETVN